MIDICGDALPTFTENAVKTMMTARAAKTWFFICAFTCESHLAFCLLGALGVHKYLKIYDLINLVSDQLWLMLLLRLLLRVSSCAFSFISLSPEF